METLEHLSRTPTVLLSTRRKDGRIVDTPMNFAVDAQGFGYFRTWPNSGKVKRLANFPGLRICRCTRNGHPQGSDQPAIATRLSGADADHARRTLIAKYPKTHGLLALILTLRAAGTVALRVGTNPARIDKARGMQPLYYRVTPVEEPTPWDGTP